jgi:hypothetical protein
MFDPAHGKPHPTVHGPFPFSMLARKLVTRFGLSLLRWPLGFSKIKRIGETAALCVDHLPAVNFLRHSS